VEGDISHFYHKKMLMLLVFYFFFPKVGFFEGTRLRTPPVADTVSDKCWAAVEKSKEEAERRSLFSGIATGRGSFFHPKNNTKRYLL